MEKRNRKTKVPLGTVLSLPFQAFADGRSGYLPLGAIYTGNGFYRIPGHELGGRLDLTGQNASVNPNGLNAFKDCIHELWKGRVGVGSFVPSTSDHNGSISLGYRLSASSDRADTFTVVNDAKTFTRSGLGFLSNLAAGQPDAPVKPLLGLTIPTREYQNGLGGTLSFSHLLNYTAKDAEFGRGSHPQLDAMVGIKIITQMHEAANTVSIQTGISVPPALDGSNDRDAGEAVEDCMAKKLTGGR